MNPLQSNNDARRRWLTWLMPVLIGAANAAPATAGDLVPTPPAVQAMELTDAQIAVLTDPARQKRIHAVEPRLLEAFEHSEAAMDAALQPVEAFFAERKAMARPFAGKLLRLYGKYLATLGIAEQAGDAVTDFFGLGRFHSPNGEPDSLHRYVGRNLWEEVIDLDELSGLLNAAAKDYVRRLKELEAKLFVEAGVDVTEAALRWPRYPLNTKSTQNSEAPFLSAAADIAGICRSDLAVTLGRGAVSWVAGDWLGDQYILEGDSLLRKLGAGIGAGQVVDGAVGTVVGLTGYSAEQAIATRVEQALEEVRQRVIDGDPEDAHRYRIFHYYATHHPDPEVNDACRAVLDAMRRSNRYNLGLRVEMENLHVARFIDRLTVFHDLIFGADIPMPMPFLIPPGEEAPPAEEIIDAARFYFQQATAVETEVQP